MKFGYHVISWGFHKISRFLPRILGELSEAGFNAFECHDLDVLPFLENTQGFVDLLSEYDMQLISVYCPGEFISTGLIDGLILKYYMKELNRFERYAEFVAAVGGENLILGATVGRLTKSDKQFVNFSKQLNKIGKTCNDLGIHLTFHPHLGTLIENESQVAKICELTDPDLVNFTLETAHQHLAGTDLVKQIEQNNERINYVHFKDVRENKFVEFGTGIIKFPEILKALKEVSYDGWITVENELNLPEISWASSSNKSPLELAQSARKYIDTYLVPVLDESIA